MAAIGRPGPSFRRSLGVLALLGAGCGPALAQPPESRPRAIVVTAEALPEALARERAVAFLRGTGVASSETPAARFTDPVCPRVLGLAPNAASAAERMIREIAVEVGAPVATAPCASNLVVMFAPDAAAVVREVERREPLRLSQLAPTERRALVEGNAPIRWWHTIEERDTSGGNGGVGRTSAAVSTAGMRGNHGRGAGSDLAAEVPTSLRYSNSLISTYAMRSLTSATVVIDQDAVMGRRLSQLAAYAALVGLAGIRPGDFRPEGSILGMFGAATAPQALTSQDLGFLQALYRMPLDRQARYHRGTLVAGMVSATSGEGEPGS